MTGIRTPDLYTATDFDQVLVTQNGQTRMLPKDRMATIFTPKQGPSYTTRAQLYADLAWTAETIGSVFGDANATYNGSYKKSGSSGSGSWSRIGDLQMSTLTTAQLAAKADAAALAAAEERVYFADLFNFTADGAANAPPRISGDDHAVPTAAISAPAAAGAMVIARIIDGDLAASSPVSDGILNADAGKTWLGAQGGDKVIGTFGLGTGETQTVSVGPSGDCYPAFGTTLRLAVGQSNAAGSQGGPASLYRTEYPDPVHLLMMAHDDHHVWVGRPGDPDAAGPEFTGTEALRGAVTGNYGNCAVESAVLRLWDRARADFASWRPRIIAANAAVGGRTIEDLSEGGQGTAWANLVAALEAAWQYRPAGERLVLDWLHMHQGESNTALATLGAAHDQFRAALEAETARIFGQTQPVRMVSWQPASYGVSAAARSILTHFQTVRAERGTFWCGGPSYPFPFGPDFLHHDALGHEMRGEMEDEIIRRIDRDGSYDPLTMLQAVRSGASQITVTLSHPALIDTTDPVVQPVAQAGIGVVGGTVTAVTVDGTQMILTTAGAASAVSAVTAAGQTQTTPRSAGAIPRTNIRSIAPLGHYRTGAAMQRWLCVQELAIS